MVVAGELTQAQVELLFAHMPVGFSVADEEDVVRFWAGDAFSTCSPKLIGRSLLDCHPKRAHAAIESLLADLKSGKKDQVGTIEHGDSGSERIIYTALRDADGTYRGVLETVVSLDEGVPRKTSAKPEPNATSPDACAGCVHDTGDLRGQLSNRSDALRGLLEALSG